MILRSQHEVIIQDKKFILSKMPFLDARKILVQYVPSFISKGNENYAINEELFLKMMSYVAVPHENLGVLPLTTKELVNSHISSSSMGILLEKEMWSYNFDFLVDGSLSTLFAAITQKLPVWTTKILKVLAPLLYA